MRRGTRAVGTAAATRGPQPSVKREQLVNMRERKCCNVVMMCKCSNVVAVVCVGRDRPRIVQQDNAPQHTACLTKAWLEKHKRSHKIIDSRGSFRPPCQAGV